MVCYIVVLRWFARGRFECQPVVLAQASQGTLFLLMLLAKHCLAVTELPRFDGAPGHPIPYCNAVESGAIEGGLLVVVLLLPNDAGLVQVSVGRSMT